MAPEAVPEAVPEALEGLEGLEGRSKGSTQGHYATENSCDSGSAYDAVIEINDLRQAVLFLRASQQPSV